MADYAPEPWTATELDVRDAEGRSLVLLNSRLSADERRQLGKLVAAAPCLLAACRTILSSPTHGDTPSEEAVELVRAAIAKATGQPVTEAR